MRIAAALLVCCGAVGPGSALAVDGTRELSQAAVDAAGGFPIVLGSGSYRLTSDLVVPDLDTTAIQVDGDRVAIDLGGHSILGPNACGTGACSPGVGRGISGPGFGATRVTNGAVVGMGNDCITLGDYAHVEGVFASGCGVDGIDVGAWSVVLASRATRNGEDGITVRGPSITAHNVAVQNSQAGPGGLAMRDARGGAPNVCDDGTCTSGSQKRVYLTQAATFDGAAAPTACAVGFHMASLWEIHDPTQLSYDRQLGAVIYDAGNGPPSSTAYEGWVRTGYPAGGALGTPGNVNCNEYTTNSVVVSGTRASLANPWVNPAVGGSPWPWGLRTASCTFPSRVWCVQD